MGVAYNSSIVTNGLVLCLDAGNVKSYPGSGTTWTDLSGRGNNGSLINGVGYNSGNLGSLSFDGTNDFVSCGTNSILNGANNEVSVEIWCGINTATDAYTGIITKLNETSYEGWAVQYISKTSGMITCRFFGGANSSNGLSFSINENQITHITCTVNSSGLMKVYLNGSFNAEYQGTVFNLNSTQPLTIGKLNYYNHYINGKIYSAKVYNRALTAAEIQQNFNALRGRYGI